MTTDFQGEPHIISYSAPIFSSITISSTGNEFQSDPLVIVAVEEISSPVLNAFDLSACLAELEADSALSEIYCLPVIAEESDGVRDRIACILGGMTKEERRILVIPVESSLQPDSVLFLRDKILNQEVPVSASDFYNVMLERWPCECNESEAFPQELQITHANTTRRIPNISLPKIPTWHPYKLARKMKWILALSSIPLIALICATLYILLRTHDLGYKREASSNNFTLTPHFQRSVDTTGLDSNSLRFDYIRLRAFISNMSNDTISMLTWNGTVVENLQFDARNIYHNTVQKGHLRCSIFSLTATNKPIIFCDSFQSHFQSSVVNLFQIDDQPHIIHYPGSDSGNMIELLEFENGDQPAIWYTMQLQCLATNSSGWLSDAEVGIGRISALGAQFVTLSTGFSDEFCQIVDSVWYANAIRFDRSDNSLDVLLLHSPQETAAICNFAYANDSIRNDVNKCTYLEDLYYFINVFIGTTDSTPMVSLEPPRAMFAKAKSLRGKNWVRFWLVYAVATDAQWSPAIGHLLFSLFDMNGNHTGNVVHSTADEVDIPQLNPTGLAVAGVDSLYVSFTGRDGTSCLARYTFTACFEGESLDCSPVIFEI